MGGSQKKYIHSFHPCVKAEQIYPTCHHRPLFPKGWEIPKMTWTKIITMAFIRTISTGAEEDWRIACTRPHAQIMKWRRRCFFNRRKPIISYHFCYFESKWICSKVLQTTESPTHQKRPTIGYVRRMPARPKVKRIPGPTFGACFT